MSHFAMGVGIGMFLGAVAIPASLWLGRRLVTLVAKPWWWPEEEPYEPWRKL